VRPGLDGERVRAGLAGLQSRHPLLRAQIELRHGQPWFSWPDTVPAIPLEQRAVSDWHEVMEAELRVVIPWQRAPLARALLLDHGAEGCTLALLFHHAIGDGLAGVAAVRDVLWEATTGRPRSPAVHERSRAVESALPQRARGVGGGLRRLGTLARLAADGVRHRDPLRCPVQQAAAPHQRTFHFESRRFDATTTAALADRARSAGATVHGAIGAAMLIGIARAAGVGDERVVAFGSPINVRDRLSPPVGDQMGMYLAASHFRGTISPRTRVWELARAIRQRITDDLESGRAIDAVSLISLFYESLGGDRAAAEDFGRKWADSNGTTGLTNLGRIELEPPPGLDIDRVHTIGFPSGLDVFNVMASAYAGRLTLTFNWPEPCFVRATAIALIDDIEATLRAAIEGDPALGSPGQ